MSSQRLTAVLRRRRLRRILLAHLVSERGQSDDEESDEDETELDDDSPDLEHEVARLLIGRKLVRGRRARRGRRAMLARCLRETNAFD